MTNENNDILEEEKVDHTSKESSEPNKESSSESEEAKLEEKEESTQKVENETDPENEANSETKNTSEDSNKESSVKESEEYKKLHTQHLRLHAEFDNYRRRTAKENLTLIENASSRVLEKLIEVVDNLDRAFSEEHKASNLEDFEKGILMIKDQFTNTLNEFGLKAIEPIGEAFDPNLHEALMQQPSEEVKEDHIISVFQKGYRVKEKVIKHAKVIVSSGSN